ncbi:MAG: 4-hydroxy-tetrahydrodipicolinate reductase [Chloroflexota bacterium]|nr:MAG: 4-hydroxy-tetrahydrodipicolinate reductase [Chloroflexota bacterium]
MPIRVVVTGATGKMSREVLNAVERASEFQPVGAVSRSEGSDLALPSGSARVPVATDCAQLLERVKPDVVIDFTNAEAAMRYARIALGQGVAIVTGSTGLSEADLTELRDLSRSTGTGVVVASNFALGAVLMTHLARIAAPFFSHAEIIELHHDQKADAPSGTSLATARAMVQARGGPFEQASTRKETLAGTRGGSLDGIAIHSVRLPGFVAHQEVIFGGTGQTLTIRHDSMGRESFMPGVLLAAREVIARKEFVLGLEKLLSL